MANIDDFLGTWYLSGDRTKPCYIRLEDDGMHLTIKLGESLGGTNYSGILLMAMRFIERVIRQEY